MNPFFSQYVVTILKFIFITKVTLSMAIAQFATDKLRYCREKK